MEFVCGVEKDKSEGDAYMVGNVHYFPGSRSSISTRYDIRKVPLVDLYIAIVFSSEGADFHIIPVDAGLGHAFEVLSKCLIDCISSRPNNGLVGTSCGLSFGCPAGWTDAEEELEVSRVYSHICRQTSKVVEQLQSGEKLNRVSLSNIWQLTFDYLLPDLCMVVLMAVEL